MAEEQQMKPRRPEVPSIHYLTTEELVRKTSLVTGITEPCEVPVSDMAVSGFGKGMRSYHKKAPSSLLQEAPNIRADGYVATDVRDDGGAAVSDPSKGVYQVPHTREAILIGMMPAPGTGVEGNAVLAGFKPADGAKDRPGKLEPTAADESRQSSMIQNAQGYTTSPPYEIQNEELTAARTTRNDFPSVKECLEQFKLVPKLFERLNEKAMDLMIKFGKRDVPLGGMLPLSQTSEKPSLHLRKHEIVTTEDVYLLLLIGVDLTNPDTSLYLQWMVQDIRLPSASPEVDVVNCLGREIAEYTPYGKPGNVHAHVLLLYQQEKPLPSNISSRIQREGFEPKGFIKSQDLEHPDPVLAFYYQTE
ncbi:hypothetical protein SUGI_0138120 [Cryptomeria japonica]|uniref:uncharacterized protein LOC131056111 n=1 Tax=Cryptomeria japonica TaxID=3369 RepID=UPI002408E316|nr:uncharacterized protein LOC131056111 [Cryptomeria japonica]GLJ10927.1 hypothetical protein SUGI_0138120 [Cryptomeria japonica]